LVDSQILPVVKSNLDAFALAVIAVPIKPVEFLEPETRMAKLLNLVREFDDNVEGAKCGLQL